MNKIDEKLALNKVGNFCEQVNINDYSEQDTLSNENYEETQQVALEEIEQILTQQGHVISDNENILITKIQHMQNKTDRLTFMNFELTKQIKQFEEERYLLQQTELNESVLDQFLETVEKEIASYKELFQYYRNNQIKVIKAKDQQLNKLRTFIQDLQLKNDCLEESRDRVRDDNDEISKINEELVVQIERLQEEFVQVSQNSSRVSRYPHEESSSFDGEIEVQLQVLIEKLMRELKMERSHKKRLNEEIKIMRQEILDLERELTAKNEQIIALQMNYLKSNRSVPLSGKNYEDKSAHRYSAFNKTKFDLHDSPQNGFKQSQNATVFKAFSLAQLLQNEIQINSKERLVIVGKIIDFYLRKITNHDFDSFQLQNLIVCNFSHRNPRLCLIRRAQSRGERQQEQSQQSMIQNLSLILNAIFSQGLKGSQNQSAKYERELTAIVTRMLKTKDYSLLQVHDMKEIILDSLKGRA